VIVVLLISGCNNKDANDYYNIGNINYNDKNYQMAIENYSKALTIDGSLTNGYIYRSAAYLETGEYELAFNDINKAIDLDKNNANAYFCRGIIYHRKMDYEKALEDYHNALILGPNNEQVKQAINFVNYLLNIQIEREIENSGQIIRKKYAEITLFDYILWNQNQLNYFQEKKYKSVVIFIQQIGTTLEFMDLDEKTRLFFDINQQWPEMRRGQKVIIYFTGKANGYSMPYLSLGDRIINDIESIE
jgi:tetratricopeptide (TPR) repeat protein